MIALVVGTLLALGALAFVLYPLVSDLIPFLARPEKRQRHPGTGPEAEAESAIVALREIEFDYATGKLSDSDHAALKAALVPRAAAEMRGELRLRSCSSCGVRPEADARFCSNCGCALAT